MTDDDRESNAYCVEKPDFKLSPFTGMARRHWIDCAKYILGRVFRSYVPNLDAVMRFPIVPGRSYPQADSPPYAFKACELEALRRTSYLAFPLMHVERDVELNKIKLREYYILHLMRLMDMDNPERIPCPEELDEGGTYGPTNELGAICMQLLCFPDLIWDDMSVEQRNSFAVMLSKWAHSYTHPHNWRFFNICMLSFLDLKGFPIDKRLLDMHLHHALSLYGGDGWYSDGHFDYYSIYVFASYAAVWSKAYGRERKPEIAVIFERNIPEKVMKKVKNRY